MTQECASDTEIFYDSIVLIINYLNMLFCNSGRPGKFQLFYKKEAGDIDGAFVLGGPYRVQLVSNNINKSNK